MQLPKQVVNGRFRENLSQEDIRFVVTALTEGDGAQADALMRLLTDSATRDTILDSPKLFDYLQTKQGKVLISSELFFYVLLRQALLGAGMDNAALASYTAAVLAKPTESITQKQGRISIKLRGSKPFSDIQDLIEALNHIKGYDWFCVSTAIADEALLLTGLFSDLLYTQTPVHRAAPSLNSYETIGKTHYRNASEHRLADEFELTEILTTLSKDFTKIRAVLNGIRQKHLCVE